MAEEVKRGPGRPKKSTLKQDPHIPVPQAAVSEAPGKLRLDSVNAAGDGSLHVLRDPWKDKDPLKIKAHPENFRLRWCNEKYRSHKGWEGWTPVQWDEEIGKNLNKYLIDIPPRFEGMAHFDSYVRMGADAILCKLPVEYWLARKEHLRQKNKRFEDSIRDQRAQQLAPGVRITEGGFETDTSDPTPLPARGYVQTY